MNNRNIALEREEKVKGRKETRLKRSEKLVTTGAL